MEVSEGALSRINESSGHTLCSVMEQAKSYSTESWGREFLLTTRSGVEPANGYSTGSRRAVPP